MICVNINTMYKHYIYEDSEHKMEYITDMQENILYIKYNKLDNCWGKLRVKGRVLLTESKLRFVTTLTTEDLFLDLL